ncbi:MAG: exopolyphosphatase [Halomonas sp.]|nr:exopolyphosphatase [Halomonas sp.]TVP48478.1 MAG: exopolyphosphatase [Halomonas sp.]
MSTQKAPKFRLVTRSDFDGLVCGALLKHLDLIDEITFVHPKDMQDGKIAIDANDITTNLPYVPGCHIAFDHHLSETVRNVERADNHVINANAPSAARVVWEYYGGYEAFPARWDDMMEAVDKGDSAQFNQDEILNPEGWVLLNFIMDARTGLGRFRDFRISNYQLMMKLIDYCREHTIEEILELDDVHERTALYREHEQLAKEQIKRCAKVQGNAVVLDLRNEDTIYATNRFVIYALYPEANISIHVMWGLKQQNTVLAIGKSILNRSSNTNIGELCLSYGGGGHLNAGTCQINNDKAEHALSDIIQRINRDG